LEDKVEKVVSALGGLGIGGVGEHAIDFEALFSDRAKAMKASEIRELLKLTNQPDIISFAGGLPSPLSFPKKEVAEIVKDVLKTRGERALQYGATEGVNEFRETIAQLMKKDGVECDESQVLVTSGSQQGLDLVAKVFIDPFDNIIVGSPTYLGGVNAFIAFQASIHTVKLDDDGLQMELLKEKLEALRKAGKKIKFLYTIPTFHNPAGVTMPEKRRKELIDLASEYDFLILEDDPYSKLRYDGEPIKPIKAFDDEGRVMYMGTFSKILAPGLRVAWIVASEDLHRKLTIVKQSTDLCTSPFGQYIAYEYVARGYMEPHIEKIKSLYKVKKDAMLKALEKYFPEEVKWTRPQGGLFLWVTCPPIVNTKEMFREAIKDRVAYVTGSSFYVDGGGLNCMRLNFSFATEQQIDEGIRRLGITIKREIEFKREHNLWGNGLGTKGMV